MLQVLVLLALSATILCSPVHRITGSRCLRPVHVQTDRKLGTIGFVKSVKVVNFNNGGKNNVGVMVETDAHYLYVLVTDQASESKCLNETSHNIDYRTLWTEEEAPQPAKPSSEQKTSYRFRKRSSKSRKISCRTDAGSAVYLSNIVEMFRSRYCFMPASRAMHCALEMCKKGRNASCYERGKVRFPCYSFRLGYGGEIP